jgi:signal transduction histidine kinase/DNA-binding response OmpR family regulator
VKRDWVLGARSDKVWAEIWSDIGPRIQRVLSTGTATWDESLLLYLERSGFAEETYHTFSYSPLANDEGHTVGMLCVVAEVTEGVINERQLDLLRKLGARLSTATTQIEVTDSLAASFGEGSPDLPFGLVYLTASNENEAQLVAGFGLEVGSAAAPAKIPLNSLEGPWPLGKATTAPEVVPTPDVARSSLQLRYWQEPPAQGLIVPIMVSEGGRPVGYFVAGLNPHRAFGEDYQGFIKLLTGQLAAAMARADEFESAKARAEALAEIDRAKTAFFSNISHEFRTPLTLMLGPLESILDDGVDRLSPDALSLLEVAHRNAQRLLRLVNALLDFSRIEAGRTEANYRPTQLFALTAELASSFRSACERAGLSLIIEGEEPSDPVYVDQEMWEKIVLNLMSNAFKFTLEGGITVRLRAVDDKAILEVRDTGVGIPPSELPRLFERFHRIQGTRGRSFEGSGIGLALVHDLVQLHGGEIAVDSQLGVGTTFKVSVPLVRGDLPSVALASLEAEPHPSKGAQAFVEEALRWIPGAQDTAGGSLPRDASLTSTSRSVRREGRVLVADDNADLRGYVTRLLDSAGYTIQPVADGAAALAAARAERPDLILTDVMMPEMDGFQLLRAIRDDPAMSDIPVVMLTARAGDEPQVEGLEAGADDYLSKPFSARELLARVSANLEMARTRRRAADAVRESEAKLQVEREFLATILAKAPIGISIVDPEGRMSMLNERGAELLGQRRLTEGPEDFVLYGAVHADGTPYASDDYPTLRAARGERIDGERVLYDRQGPEGAERLVLEVDAVPIRGPDGALAGALTVFEDAGARERAEDELRGRIALAIAEREAAREEVHQLQKLETIGQLTGGIAHDFNNLLTPIVGALSIISRRYATDDRAEKIISVAQQATERARVLVNRLLMFGRRQHLEPRPVDLGQLVTGMRDLIERSLSGQIGIRYTLNAGSLTVFADPNQLELAILNLCVNSRDAMPDGGDLEISVETVSGDQDPELGSGRYVRVSVADTGIGMDAETLKRAIEPFYSTKDVGKGTGLGLSMVHGLAAQSGGLLRLQSALGRGTTASILLPAVDIEVDAPAQHPAAGDYEGSTQTSLKILLVDDEELVRVSTAQMLELNGHEVEQAASGPAALQILKTRRDLNVLIADYMMPGMTGVALVAAARALQPALPALLITGYAGTDANPDDGLARLGKPFGQSELNAALREVVEAVDSSGPLGAVP